MGNAMMLGLIRLIALIILISLAKKNPGNVLSFVVPYFLLADLLTQVFSFACSFVFTGWRPFPKRDVLSEKTADAL